MLKFDPISKQYIDDGLPEVPGGAPPLAAPDIEPIQPLAPPSATGSGGGTTIQIPDGGSLLPAPAAREQSVSYSKPIESVAEVANQGVVKTAQDREVMGINAETNVNVQEADNEVAREVAKGKLLEQAKKEAADLAAKQEGEIQARNAEEKTFVDKAAKDAISAGRARIDYWKGNPVGEFLAAVVQSVAAGEMARQGRGGQESPAERILLRRIETHERAAVMKWEASKEARDLKLKDRAAFDTALARKKVEAANQSARDMEVLNSKFDAIGKGFGAEKAQALGAIKAAAMEKANALNEQKRIEGLRTIKKSEDTKRTAADTGGKLTEGESKALAFGSTIVDASNAIGDKPLTNETIKQLNSNIAQLQKGPAAGVISNWLKQNDMSPAPDDFFTGIADPSQKEIARQWMNASNARMRYESGGAVTPIENLSDMMRNAPTVGDSPEKQRQLRNEQARFGTSILPKKAAGDEVRARAASPTAGATEQPKPFAKRPDGSRFTKGGTTYEMKNGEPVKVKDGD
jgi:hypothetical protein